MCTTDRVLGFYQLVRDENFHKTFPNIGTRISLMLISIAEQPAAFFLFVFNLLEDCSSHKDDFFFLSVSIMG